MKQGRQTTQEERIQTAKECNLTAWGIGALMSKNISPFSTKVLEKGDTLKMIAP